MWTSELKIFQLHYRGPFSEDIEMFQSMYKDEDEENISQIDAKNAFDVGLLLGDGAYGIVKYSLLDNKPIVVKKIVTKEMALIEYHAHHAFYKNIRSSCKEYFSKPLKLNLNENIYYTVQTPLHNPNEIIGTFSSIKSLLNTLDSCMYVIFSVQEIIKCLDSLSIAHGDIKSDNVLVVKRDFPTLRIIDFGCAHEKGSSQENMLSMQFSELFDLIFTEDNMFFIEEALANVKPDKFTEYLMKKNIQRKKFA